MFVDNPELEEEHRKAFLARELYRTKLIFALMTCGIGLATIYEQVRGENVELRLRIASIVAGLLLLLFMRTKMFADNFQTTLTLCLIAIGVSVSLAITSSGKMGAAMFQGFVFLLLRIRFVYAAVVCALNIIIFFIVSDSLNFFVGGLDTVG